MTKKCRNAQLSEINTREGMDLTGLHVKREWSSNSST